MENAPLDTERDVAQQTAETPGGFVCEKCGHVHDAPEAESGQSLSELNPRTLFLRNLLAVVAAGLFLLSLLSDQNHMTFKAIAYIIGALAYFGEVLMLTDCFRHKPSEESCLCHIFSVRCMSYWASAMRWARIKGLVPEQMNRC